MKVQIFRSFMGALAVLISSTAFAQDKNKRETGYTDTPLLPDSKWRVHGDARPRPTVVKPGETASDAPSDAIVLFDGSDLSNWEMAKKQAKADWIVKDGYFEVPPKGQGVGGYIQTKKAFSGDVQLHIEWASPAEVVSNSQGRGNSGVFFPGKFEVQILDSYENKSYADGQASALYGWKPPLVNACRKPGVWQSYDIIFEAPKWEDGKNVKKAYVTVFHNGVLTHHRQEFLGPSLHRRVANYKKPTGPGPIALQNHGNPIRFRNIWVRELDLSANE